MINKIHVLGDGVTAMAVKNMAKTLGLAIVSIENADCVITSPGIPPEQYPSADAEFISEIEFAYRLWIERGSLPTLIGVTGTNGKSTVTALISHILGIPACGNIGDPLINYVGSSHPMLVVELSSYQLEGCKHFKTDISVILNISPDHLERHKTMAVYASEKAKISAHHDQHQTTIYPINDSYLRELFKDYKGKRIDLKKRLPAVESQLEGLKLFGNGNEENAYVAAVVAQVLGKSAEEVSEKISTFSALEHRLEPVLEKGGILFVNDSKSTNPESVFFAVDAFTSSVHLILSGDDKGLDYRDLLMHLRSAVASVTVFGGISGRISKLVEMAEPSFVFNVETSLEDAVARAADQAQEKGVVLFSPGSSSFDLFKNFEDRGKKFKETVLKRYGRTTEIL